VKRSDGSYVFHFVNVVDDIEMQMTHVIRGEDHLMNTPKHLQLFEAFGVEPPKFAHIPLILNPDGSKMSKRDVGAAVGDYPRQGFLSGAVVNFIALLGWSSKTDEEIFTLLELVDRFSLEAINRAPARFDFEKCKWVNQQHIAKISTETFADLAKRFVEAENLPITENYPAVITAVKEKVRLLTEVPHAIDFLITDTAPQDEEAVAKAKGNPNAALLPALAEHMATLTDWSADIAKEAIAAVAQANGAKPGQLMFPVRVALSGRAHGPDLGDVFAILGKEKTVERLRGF
jgi:glutamyl-tRNA synthetase